METQARALLEHCLSKPGAYIDYPFGEIPVCVKVGKRLFAQIYTNRNDLKITLNCDMMSGEFFRNLYPGTVVRGYHCPPQLAPYFNTVYLGGSVPEAELKMMIDLSYSAVVKKLPLKVRRELSGGVSENK